MIRRLFPIAVSLVAVASLAACATFTANDEAASVNGVALERSDLELYTRELFDITTPTVTADSPRQVLTNWVIDELVRQYLAQQGIGIDDASRDEATRQVTTGLSGQGLTVSDATLAFLVDSTAARIAYNASQPDGALRPFAESADIVVDPRYGAWSLDGAQILALG